MDFLNTLLTETEVYGWETVIGDWFFLFAFGFLAIEVLRYIFTKKFSLNLAGDIITNYLTLVMFIGINVFLLTGLYLSTYSWVSQFQLFDISISWGTILICVILADFAYYWEHRFMHRVNFAWATHSVHHSSPFFNISVAYRFGPMDGVWPIVFHLPLVLIGFNPFVVFFAEMFVQIYQTILHTETIKKLPKPIEATFNTPSHHRVHHGSNPQYLDKNYAGIFIIWDKMFRTFAKEEEEVVYGLVKPINSINPLVAFFHGFWRLGKNVVGAKGAKNKFMYFAGPPEWEGEGSDR
ncbi:MAG: sterol desaturase family protein [Litorimonas sp.]